MGLIYDYILDFINAFFPNELSIELLQLNELLAYVVTLSIVVLMFRFFYNLIFKRK